MWTLSEAPIKLIGTVVGLLVTGTTLTYKGVTFVDDRFAHQQDYVREISDLKEGLNQTNERIDYGALNDVVRQKDLAVQRLEDRNHTADRGKWPQADRDRVREIEQEKAHAERKLNVYEQRILDKTK